LVAFATFLSKALASLFLGEALAGVGPFFPRSFEGCFFKSGCFEGYFFNSGSLEAFFFNSGYELLSAEELLLFYLFIKFNILMIF
jgi:hypothetical protein